MNALIDVSPRNKNSSEVAQESFLNLQALNKSFLEKSSSPEIFYKNSKKGSSSGESFDRSSESNPYQTSSESEDDIQDVIFEESKKAKKLENVLSVERSNKNISILLSHYLPKEEKFHDLVADTSKLIKRLTLQKFDLLFFYIAASIKEREDDLPVLLQKLKGEIFELNKKHDDEKINSMIYSIVEVQEYANKAKVCSIFAENSGYFLQRVLDDRQIFFELFIDLIQSGEINHSQLFKNIFVLASTLYRNLQEKKYDQLLFLLKNNVSIIHTKLVAFNNVDDSTYENYLHKPLLRINLKLVTLFYAERTRDVNMIKKFLIEVPQTTQEYQELLKVFIRFKVNSVAKDTFRALTDSNAIFDTKILQFSLKYFQEYHFKLIQKYNQMQNLEFLWFLANQESVSLAQWLNEERTQKLLVDQLYTVEGKHFEYIIYFLKKVRRLKEKQTIKRLSETLISRIDSSRQGQFLYSFYNPLKIALLVVELMQYTLMNVMHHKNKLSKALDLYYKFSQIYCSLITEDILLIELLKDVDLEKRKVIYLIDQNKSAVISSTQIVEDAIESMWNGNMAPRTSLVKMFSVTQNLFFEELSDHLIEKDPRRNDIFMMLNTNYKNHHFSLQRVVLTYNCRIRNQIDQYFILGLMLIVLFNFSSLFAPQLIIQQNMSAFDSEDLSLILTNIADLRNEYMRLQVYLDIIIGLNMTFKPLFVRYYDWTQQIETSFNAQDICGFTLGIFSLFQLIIMRSEHFLTDRSRFQVLIQFTWIYITLVFLQSLLSVRNFKIFGPMMKALWLVVLECSKLFFIFIVVELLFGFIAYFSFFENINGRFTSLSQSLLFLIEALFGQFQFEDFNQPSPIFAPIYLNVYLFFSPIIFMQLLVAVLTFTFENASRGGRINYYLSIIGNLHNLEYDAVSGCLVTIPILGSFFNIIFILTHMFSDPDPALREQNIDTLKKVSRFLVKAAYFPLYFVISLFSLVMVVICSPIFYVVKLFRILVESNRGEGYSKSKRFFKWLALGFGYMTIQTCKDLQTNFTYLVHGKYLNESPQLNISNSTYQIVASVAKDFFLKTRDRQNKVILSEYLNAVLKKIKVIELQTHEKQIKLSNQAEFQKSSNEQPIEGSIELQCCTEGDISKKKSDKIQGKQEIGESKKIQSFSFLKLSLPSDRQQLRKNSNQKKDQIDVSQDVIASVNERSELRNSNRPQYFTDRICSLASQEDSDLEIEDKPRNQFGQKVLQTMQVEPTLQVNGISIKQIEENANHPADKREIVESINQPVNQIDVIETGESIQLEENDSQIQELNIGSSEPAKLIPYVGITNPSFLSSKQQQSNDSQQDMQLNTKSQEKDQHQYTYDKESCPIKRHTSVYNENQIANWQTGKQFQEDSLFQKQGNPETSLGSMNNDNHRRTQSQDSHNKSKHRHHRSQSSQNKNSYQTPSMPSDLAESSNLHNIISPSKLPHKNIEFQSNITVYEPVQREQLNLTCLDYPSPQFTQKMEHINFDEVRTPNSHYQNHQRNLSSGSSTGKISHKMSLQAYENSLSQRKRKTTYQMWKKMKKEDSSGSNSIKDSDNLFQFLDAFVVDEEELIQDDTQSVYSKNDLEESTNDWIYIGNLLKLMYHYSKNDVKLARFNILFQAIKKLFKED